MTTTSLAIREEALSVGEVKNQINQIQELMKAAMQEDQHYGVIPGCGNKKVLLKPGAEKLAMMFRLGPKFDITKSVLPNNHREYEITCKLYHIETETFVAQGVGSCSTMESKYRYRSDGNFEMLEESIPKDYKERKVAYRKEGFGCKKIDGSWAWVQFNDSDKAENPDIADTYNTVLKMAKKRALIDAILTATAASDIFTQDLEDGSTDNKPPTQEARKENREERREEPRKENGKQRDTRPISDPQNKMLFARMSKKNMFKDDMAVLALKVCKVDSSKDIQRWQVDSLLEAIEQWKPPNADQEFIHDEPSKNVASDEEPGGGGGEEELGGYDHDDHGDPLDGDSIPF